jgi:hypothetical protein
MSQERGKDHSDQDPSANGKRRVVGKDGHLENTRWQKEEKDVEKHEISPSLSKNAEKTTSR